MSDWQPIESAPRDGTSVLIADARCFTRAYWTFREEPPTTSLGYGDPATGIPEGGWPNHKRQTWSITQVPNPKAGRRTYFWLQDNPIAFAEDDIQAPDYDGCFESITPTHWMPLPQPPEAEK